MKRLTTICRCGRPTRSGQADCNRCHAADMRSRRAAARAAREAARAAQDDAQAQAFERMRTKLKTTNPPEANPQ